MKDIRQLSLEQLTALFVEQGEKPFRARQLYEWLWKKSAWSFDHLTNLPLNIREWLAKDFVINAVEISEFQKSNDGTKKVAFGLHDGNLVEGVLIPTEKRLTACISSQVGCSLSCKFCATGYLDRKRNLDASEIYDQVVHIRNICDEEFHKPLTNIVYMGMGEPLLNYSNVLKSVELITSDQGLGMAARRITVSTAGIAGMIRRLGDDEVKFNLALSLHAANDEKRNEIMGINKTNNLDNLKSALKYYYQKTKNQVTLEYIVFAGFNDSIQDARELFDFAKQLPSKINIIEYNPIDNASFKNADLGKMEKFSRYLEEKGMNVYLRKSRGKDIDAACGQLANKST
ncbi:MAG: 23S rRNA (adenine(2503)-C(2))-methyltransferase RlmN [Cyclobacteriaceae bacterium]|nr:23S rRNA (adenine(2503)-C(2))-methyltransferase RlmN [Cyclobacteriaceae bacterium]